MQFEEDARNEVRCIKHTSNEHRRFSEMRQTRKSCKRENIMEEITLPTKIKLEEKSDNEALVIVEPCYPGYGTTLGNALRRTLLSSLPGAAVSAVKIKGVDHEFSTIENVKEDVVEIIMNLKSARHTV